MKYAVKQANYDPYTSRGFYGIESKKELRKYWDGSLEEGDEIYELKFFGRVVKIQEEKLGLSPKPKSKS